MTRRLLVLPCLLALLPAVPVRAEAAPPSVRAVLAADGRLAALRAALERADLAATLDGDGPFTVFAPTQEAFAALPAETLDAILVPAGRDALRRVLLGHVVAGRVRAADLRPGAAWVAASGSLLALGGVRVVQADVACGNGVIHVIDRVLPTALAADASQVVEAVLGEAIEEGSRLFNGGDAAGCARTYEAVAARLLEGRRVLGELHRDRLEAAVAARDDSASARAWRLRRAFDAVLDDLRFEPVREAELPAGFPEPGPVGRVVVKRYPRYRAARAEGAAAFWTLFRHIQARDVAMTAPVEMRMDERMRAQDMAFLYESPQQGQAGPDGAVRVVDLRPIEVFSIGMRGGRGAEALARAKAAIERRMREDGATAAGAWRVLGYNSPRVLGDRRYWELQIPITR